MLPAIQVPAFYDLAAAREALLREVARWEGTRYSRHGAAPGALGGVGCVRYTLALHEATGAIDPVDPADLPDYPDDWSRHRQESLLDLWLERMGYITTDGVTVRSGWRATVLLDASGLQAGDVSVFAPARCTHHLGTMLSPTTFTHAFRPAGVACADLAEAPRYGRRVLAWGPRWRYAIRLPRRP